MAKKKKAFYGEEEVLGVEKIENERVKLSLSNGTTVELSGVMYEETRTTLSTDATDLRNMRAIPVVGELLATLLKWDVKADMEIDYIFRKVNESLNGSIKQAEDIKWGKERSERTLYDYNKVLTNDKDKDNDNRTPSKGSSANPSPKT